MNTPKKREDNRSFLPSSAKSVVVALKRAQVSEYAQFLISSRLTNLGIAKSSFKKIGKSVMPGDCHFLFVSLGENTINSEGRISLSSSEGNYTFTRENTEVTLKGDYLEVYVPLKYQGSISDIAPVRDFEAAKKLIGRLVAFLRMTFGASSVLELQLSVIRHTRNAVAQFVSSPHRDEASFVFDDDVYRRLIPHVVDKFGRLSTVPTEVLDTLSAAEEQHRAELRFILLWTALELSIGGGDERLNYCRNVLGSEECNQIVYRAFKLRGEWLHDGGYSNLLGKFETVLRMLILTKYLPNDQDRRDVAKLIEDLSKENGILGPKVNWLTVVETRRWEKPLRDDPFR